MRPISRPAGTIAGVIQDDMTLGRTVHRTPGQASPCAVAEGLLGPITPLLALPALAVALRRRVRWKFRDHLV